MEIIKIASIFQNKWSFKVESPELNEISRFDINSLKASLRTRDDLKQIKSYAIVNIRIKSDTKDRKRELNPELFIRF